MSEWQKEHVVTCDCTAVYMAVHDYCPFCGYPTETNQYNMANAQKPPKPRGLATEFTIEPVSTPKAKQSSLELKFIERWQLFAPDNMPASEYRFHSTRKWRFDFAWLDKMIAVEMEGGVWSRGRHVRPQGFIDDLEKYNAATELGWRVLRYESVKIEYLDQLKRILELE